MAFHAEPQRTGSGGHGFDLEFCVGGAGQSFIGAQFVRYPFHVCRALYADESDPGAGSGAFTHIGTRICKVTLQSVSGGLFESDRVSGRIQARVGVRAHVSTSASSIVHTMRGGWAEQSVELVAQAGALLEYMPEPLILFPGSRLRSRTGVCAHPSSAVVFCDGFLAHDPAASGLTFGTLDARVSVNGSDGRLLARERMRLDGAVWRRAQTGISDRYTVNAGLWIIRRGDCTALLKRVRNMLDDDAVYAGASELPNSAGVLVRLLSADAVALRRSLQRLHAQVRRWLLADLASNSPSAAPMLA